MASRSDTASTHTLPPASEPHNITKQVSHADAGLPIGTDAEKEKASPAGDVEATAGAPTGPPKFVMPGAPFPEGGLYGWMAVAGAWFAIFATFGYANTFGAYQSYYQFEGYPTQSPSTISWIGSIQLFFQFSLGAVAGPLYDKGYFRHLVGAGSVLYIVCLFMTSLAHEFWQTLLAQAFGIGIGVGLIFLPAISILSQYFLRRRALAIGIAVTGSSVGGIILPIMLNKLIISHGFRKAVQYSGYLLLGTLILANALMHPRFVPAALRPAGGKPPSPGAMFKSKPYLFAVLGSIFVAWGLFFPIYYLQVYAQESGLSQNLVFYTLAILNAASVFGRISPNFLADYVGSLNLITIMCAGSGILCFAVFGAGTPGGLIVVAIFFGFFSGAYVSLISPAVISLSDHPSEIGIRLGFAFLGTSVSALTGTPITGALLARFGFYAPIVWSGVTVLTGSAFFALAAFLQGRAKGTWKV